MDEIRCYKCGEECGSENEGLCYECALDQANKTIARMKEENDALRSGLIKVRFYFEHMKNEAEYDPVWMADATQRGIRMVDSWIMEANLANPLEEYFQVRPDNGYMKNECKDERKQERDEEYFDEEYD